MRQLKAIQKSLSAAPPWLLALVCLVLGVVVGLLAGAGQALSSALLSLVGVALGGLIAATANYLATQEAHKAQIATATWPERMKAHQEAYERTERMIMAVLDTDREILNEADTWFDHNCLYLEDGARQEFQMLCRTASSYISAVQRKDKDTEKALISRFDDYYRSTLKAIMHGAGSHISDEMLERLSRERKKELRET